MSGRAVLINHKVKEKGASLSARMMRLGRAAWVALAYNVLVVLWGAGVRATGSGAGCGSHYPLCNGEVVPRSIGMETFTEFTHRLMSGVALLIIVALVVWSVRLVRASRSSDVSEALTNRVRSVCTFAFAALFFTVTEAAIGAGLVIYELVAQDDSVARAVWLAVHLVNTFLLMAALTLLAWRASAWSEGVESDWREIGNAGAWLFAVCFGLMLVLGASGAVAALGDTLFPVKSLKEGLQNDLAGAGHYLVQLRVLHPIIAGLTTIALSLTAWWTIKRGAGDKAHAKKLAWMVVALLCVEVAAGVVNVLLLAPVWMQIVHLFLADMLWIAFVMLTAAMCSRAPLHVPAVRRANAPLDFVVTPMSR